MPTFQPPTSYGTPICPPDVGGLEARLFRHYRSLKKGWTVLQRSDDSWVVKEYPTQQEIDQAKRVYMGGHVYTVDTAEAAVLTAAGFGAYLS